MEMSKVTANIAWRLSIVNSPLHAGVLLVNNDLHVHRKACLGHREAW